jgi:TonB family protein
MCTRPARPLAAAWWALAAVLSLGANAPATVTLPAGDDLLVLTDPNLGTTYVSPWMDDWPRPDVLIYPMVAATKTGARTVILRILMRDAPASFGRSVHLAIGGEDVSLPLDRPNAVTEDNDGCRSVTRVSVGGQEQVLRRLAHATDVRVLFGENGWTYRLNAADLSRARRMLGVFDGTELPHGDAFFEPGPGVSVPQLIESTRVFPKFPKHPAIRRTDVKVTLAVTLGVDGAIERVRILEPAGGDCGFEEAVLEAIRQWKYKPGMKQGQPVRATIKVLFTFTRA